MPDFKKSPPELMTRFEELVALVPAATTKQMFGYPTCVLGGNMFMGLHDDYLILRLSEADRAAFAEEVGGRVFEPMPGRPMKEYVVVPADVTKGPEVEQWVRASYDYAHSLAPKKPKKG
ncbi:MAG: TfoX/Sxy family protein [Actinomycetota bacterium]|nr:TfoX/Sxy family protein [Actinomycetota bacterium]